MVKKLTNNTVIPNLIYKQDVKKALMTMGIRKGMVVLLEAKGNCKDYLLGGEQALIEAIMEVVGYEGTIIVSTFTPQLLDPSQSEEKITRSLWKDIRKYSTGFDLKLTMPLKENYLAHQFLRNEGVIRSYHPLYSFAVWGKYAKLICDKHPLHFGLNEDSPLGRLLDFQGKIILFNQDIDDSIGIKYNLYKNIQLPIRIVSAPILINHRTLWKDMLDVQYNTTHIEKLISGLKSEEKGQCCKVGDVMLSVYDATDVQSLSISYD